MKQAVLIGRGYWGKILQKYIPQYFVLRGVFGSDVAREDLVKILQEVDVAFIATPLCAHFDCASLALEHHCDVFLEKPSVRNKEEFYTLLNLAKKHNKILFTDYIYTFSRSITYVLNLLKTHPSPIRSLYANIAQYGNFYPNESVLEVIGVHYLSVFALMQEMQLLQELCVKKCTFLDEKSQSATLELSAQANHIVEDKIKENKEEIRAQLDCSLLDHTKKRILRIQTEDFTLSIDMLASMPLTIHTHSAKSNLHTHILPLFDETNNLTLALESFQNMGENPQAYTAHLRLCEVILGLLTHAHDVSYNAKTK
ncbi:MAG: Gfo/Idh/MocA family oxidoreductase [Helicobacter sp.]|uniref:Gfo/Idh/MocA family protein n=1 Tax=Helicobacter sp. TaxID=218 RepID=UPI0025BBC1C9|nr:Gfo/Idh/MocA family oxidoreductase [Helicobacter sp.]MCH5314097.1 Gfo/Idh/MocA family oxidoreductase [Helicobacter sp.]